MKVTNLILALILLQAGYVLTQNWYDIFSNSHLYDCFNWDYYFYANGTYHGELVSVWFGFKTEKFRKGDWVLQNADQAIAILSMQDSVCVEKTTYYTGTPFPTTEEMCDLKAQTLHFTVLDRIKATSAWHDCASEPNYKILGTLKVGKDCDSLDDCYWGEWVIKAN